MSDPTKPPTSPAVAPKPPSPAPPSGETRPAWTQPRAPSGEVPAWARPSSTPAKPAASGAAAVKPVVVAKPTVAKPAAEWTPVIEDTQHPFEEFISDAYADLFNRIDEEGRKLKVPADARVKVMVTILTIRIAAIGYGAGFKKEDILSVFNKFWALQRPLTTPK